MTVIKWKDLNSSFIAYATAAKRNDEPVFQYFLEKVYAYISRWMLINEMQVGNSQQGKRVREESLV